MLTDAKALLHRAVQGRYAIAAVNIRSAHEAIAALDAAQALRAPLLLDLLPSSLPPCPEGYCSWLRELAQAAETPAAISWEAETDAELRLAAASGATDAACRFSPSAPESAIRWVRRAHALGLSACIALRGDGSVTRGIVPSLRGVDWSSTYASPVSNVSGIRVPTLVMGMTAGWEYIASESIYERNASRDKSICFVEGAQHTCRTAQDCEAFPGQFGDTLALTLARCDAWLAAPGRFL